jgi:hypothetical protein
VAIAGHSDLEQSSQVYGHCWRFRLSYPQCMPGAAAGDAALGILSMLLQVIQP